MTLSLYLQCAAMLILGQGLQIFLIKIPDLKTRAALAKQQFIWADWWAADWNVVIATSIIGVMAIIGLNELVHWKPEILDYVKWFFAGLGGFGSNIAMAYWSTYAKYFNGVIGTKTDPQPPASQN